jgi:hydrogenase-4 component E
MMKNPLNALIIILVVSNFYLLSSSRLRALIRITAFQGFFLGLLPFITQLGQFSQHTVIIGVGAMVLKGLVIPLLLFRALRGVEEYRDKKPHIGYTLSIACGIAITMAAFWIGSMIPRSVFFPFPSVISLSISMAATGLFLIIGRTKALTQIIGYLVLENAIYGFGISLSASQSLIIEMGVLLDLLVGIFIMGVVLYHINREFDSINTDSLEALKE